MSLGSLTRIAVVAILLPVTGAVSSAQQPYRDDGVSIARRAGMALDGDVFWYLSPTSAEDAPFELSAFDAATGNVLQRITGDAPGEIAAVPGGLCLVSSPGGILRAYRTTASTPVWVYDAPDQIEVFGFDDTALYITARYGPTFTEQSSRIEAIRLDTGTTRWTHAASDQADELRLEGDVVGDGVVIARSFFHTTRYGIDAATGDLTWSTSSTEIQSSVAFVMDGIAFAQTLSNVQAFDIHTGRELWKATLDSGDGRALFSGIMHVADGVAYGAYRYPDILSPEPAYQIPTVLIAFDARSGLERWRYPNEDPFASWLRVTSDERAVYVGSAGDVAALDPQTGRQIWSRSFESGGHVAGLSPSALILSNKEEFQFRGEVWTEQYAEIRGLDPATGQRNWLWMPDGWLEGEVLVGAGRVFTQVDEPVAVDRVNRRLVAINDASGQIVWELSHSLAVPPNPDWFTPATDDPPASTLSWRDWVSLVFTAVWTVIVAVALVRRTRNRNRGPTRIGGRKPTDGLV